MTRTPRTEPSLTEWAVLGLLCERPAHGWDVARAFAADGEIGQVWTVSRPLVYRAVNVLRDLGYVTERGTTPSATGPRRTLLAPTPRGRQALRRWLARPTEHMRDLRSELLVKLLLLGRGRQGLDPTPSGPARSPRTRRERTRTACLRSRRIRQDIIAWRLSTARAARAFVEALLDERIGDPINYEAIGHIQSAHDTLDGMPLQPAADASGPSRITITEPHRGCLADLDGFSHIWVLAHLHESVGWAATVDPFLGDQPRGTFATRSPHRPNPVSLSLCGLVAVETDSVLVEGVDLLDGTPILDLKPYVPLFDTPSGPTADGWFHDRAELIFQRTSDGRFAQRSSR